MNTTELKVEMLRHDDTSGDLANALGISRTTFSAKSNGNADFTQAEIAKIKERYTLSAQRVEEIFFTD